MHINYAETQGNVTSMEIHGVTEKDTREEVEAYALDNSYGEFIDAYDAYPNESVVFVRVSQ